MTQEEFKEILNKSNIIFFQEGETLVISRENESVYLNFIKNLPSNVRFENTKFIDLFSLICFPKGIVFDNNRSVWLSSKVASTMKNAIFKNTEHIFITSIKGEKHGIELVFTFLSPMEALELALSNNF